MPPVWRTVPPSDSGTLRLFPSRWPDPKLAGFLDPRTCRHFDFYETSSVLETMDQWVRRRLRSGVWRQWNRGRYTQLRRLGFPRTLTTTTAASSQSWCAWPTAQVLRVSSVRNRKLPDLQPSQAIRPDVEVFPFAGPLAFGVGQHQFLPCMRGVSAELLQPSWDTLILALG